MVLASGLPSLPVPGAGSEPSLGKIVGPAWSLPNSTTMEPTCSGLTHENPTGAAQFCTGSLAASLVTLGIPLRAAGAWLVQDQTGQTKASVGFHPVCFMGHDLLPQLVLWSGSVALVAWKGPVDVGINFWELRPCCIGWPRKGAWHGVLSIQIKRRCFPIENVYFLGLSEGL